MKVLVYGDIGGSGGYYRYCKGLFSNKSIPKDILVYFVTSENFHNKLGKLDDNVKVIKHPWIDSPLRIKRYLWHLWVYPRIVRKIIPDIEFYPSGRLRLFFRKALTVATCHNLLLFDAFELSRIKDRLEKNYFIKTRLLQVKSFKKSDGLIFLSNYSKNVILPQIDSLKLNTVISHGLDKEFLFLNNRYYTLGNPVYILYVSPIFQYKNHLNVVKAFQELIQEINVDLHLNFVGGGDSSAKSELVEYIKVNNLTEVISIKEFLNTDSLISEYQANDIFIFASSSETFGITLLEAMAAKLPIACSERTGLQDILQDAGIYFDPFNVLSIKKSLKELLCDLVKRQKIGQKAFNLSMGFSWQNCTKETFDFIKFVYTTKNNTKNK
jgi:glycosyltransferase involved in cell wall biosynthesis